MNSQDWKNIVGAVAPGIATILGGPVAGAAVGALSQALLGKPNGTEAEIAAVVQTATPEVLAKIKQADADLQTALANAGVRIEEIASADRASARAREIQTGDHWTPRLLMLIVGLVWVGANYVVFTRPIMESNVDLIMRALGILDALMMMSASYYLGTSASSFAKTRILDRVVNHR